MDYSLLKHPLSTAVVLFRHPHFSSYCSARMSTSYPFTEPEWSFKKKKKAISPSSLRPFTDFAWHLMKLAHWEGLETTCLSKLIAGTFCSSVSYWATLTLAFFRLLECPKLFFLQSILISCVLCLECSFLCLCNFHL